MPVLVLARFGAFLGFFRPRIETDEILKLVYAAAFACFARILKAVDVSLDAILVFARARRRFAPASQRFVRAAPAVAAPVLRVSLRFI